MKLSSVIKLLKNYIFILFLTHQIVDANPKQAETVCKAKAKEIAQMTFSSCIEEAKSHELDRIKSEYKDKLSQLKKYYDKKIKSLSPQEKLILDKGTQLNKQKDNSVTQILPSKEIPTQELVQPAEKLEEPQVIESNPFENEMNQTVY